MVTPNWRHRGTYIRTRVQRKKNLGEINIEPAWADEAYLDVDAVRFADPSSRSGRGVRTVGWSESVGMLITVITIEDGGVLWGVNAWKANETDREVYRKGAMR